MLIAWLMAAGVSLWVWGIGDERSGAGVPHLRPLDSLAGAAIEGGLGRSPTFAALMQTIEGSEFIVYVESSRKLRDGMKGCLVHGGGGPRYLRVLLKTGLSVDERIEVLAHELQHVREVIHAGISTTPSRWMRCSRALATTNVSKAEGTRSTKRKPHD